MVTSPLKRSHSWHTLALIPLFACVSVRMRIMGCTESAITLLINATIYKIALKCLNHATLLYLSMLELHQLNLTIYAVFRV